MKLKPNEKARQLLDRFNFEVRDLDGDVSHTIEEAIQCALLCVDEIEKIQFEMYGQDKDFTMYFLEVKKEIQSFSFITNN